MKKNILTLTAIVCVAATTVFTGCKKDDADTTLPVVSVVGASPYFIQKGTTFVDPGATASDDVDGTILATGTGTVTMSVTGQYTRTYTATDAAGNVGTATRSVFVVDVDGHYANITDETPVGAAPGAPYADDLYLATDGTGKVNVTKFGNYLNGNVYFNLTGLTTCTIPTQTVTCGTPPNNLVRTFSGTGTVNNTAVSPTATVTLLFTEVQGASSVNSKENYAR